MGAPLPGNPAVLTTPTPAGYASGYMPGSGGHMMMMQQQLVSVMLCLFDEACVVT